MNLYYIKDFSNRSNKPTSEILFRFPQLGSVVQVLWCAQLVHETYSNILPGFRVAADAEERQDRHEGGVEPAARHDLGRRAELEAAVQVDGVGDGVPSLDGDHCQGEYGQLAREHRQEPRHPAAVPCTSTNTSLSPGVSHKNRDVKETLII